MELNGVSVYNGRLMAPYEVQAVKRTSRPLPKEIMEHWFVCGDISEAFWRELCRGPFQERAMRLSTLASPHQTAYVVFTVQLGGWQSRILLSLNDKKVLQLIAEGAQTGIWLSLGRDDGEDALLMEFLLEDPEHLRPIVVMGRNCRLLSDEDARLDFQQATMALTEHDAIPSLYEDCPVKDISLTLVLPDVFHSEEQQVAYGE
jgi:hypothetical protein